MTRESIVNGVVQHPLSKEFADQLYEKLLTCLLLDGSREMIDTLKSMNVIPKTHNIYYLGSPTKYFAGSYCYYYMGVNTMGFLHGGKLRTYGLVTSPFHLQSWDGSAYQNTITCIGGYADIPRCGDIDILGTPKIAGVAGVDGSFVSQDGKTVTVSKGLITSIV